MSEWVLPLAVGAATGVLSGFGVGGGTLLLVYMTAFAGVDQHLAQGINLLYFLPAGLMALPAHVKNGYIEKPVLLPAIGAGLVCGVGGHRYGGRAAAQILRSVSHRGGADGAVWAYKGVKMLAPRRRIGYDRTISAPKGGMEGGPVNVV